MGGSKWARGGGSEGLMMETSWREAVTRVFTRGGFWHPRSCSKTEVILGTVEKASEVKSKSLKTKLYLIDITCLIFQAAMLCRKKFADRKNICFQKRTSMVSYFLEKIKKFPLKSFQSQ